MKREFFLVVLSVAVGFRGAEHDTGLGLWSDGPTKNY